MASQDTPGEVSSTSLSSAFSCSSKSAPFGAKPWSRDVKGVTLRLGWFTEKMALPKFEKIIRKTNEIHEIHTCNPCLTTRDSNMAGRNGWGNIGHHVTTSHAEPPFPLPFAELRRAGSLPLGAGTLPEARRPAGCGEPWAPGGLKHRLGYAKRSARMRMISDKSDMLHTLNGCECYIIVSCI